MQADRKTKLDLSALQSSALEEIQRLRAAGHLTELRFNFRIALQLVAVRAGKNGEDAFAQLLDALGKDKKWGDAQLLVGLYLTMPDVEELARQRSTQGNLLEYAHLETLAMVWQSTLARKSVLKAWSDRDLNVEQLRFYVERRHSNDIVRSREPLLKKRLRKPMAMQEDDFFSFLD